MLPMIAAFRPAFEEEEFAWGLGLGFPVSPGFGRVLIEVAICPPLPVVYEEACVA